MVHCPGPAPPRPNRHHPLAPSPAPLAPPRAAVHPGPGPAPSRRQHPTCPGHALSQATPTSWAALRPSRPRPRLASPRPSSLPPLASGASARPPRGRPPCPADRASPPPKPRLSRAERPRPQAESRSPPRLSEQATPLLQLPAGVSRKLQGEHRKCTCARVVAQKDFVAVVMGIARGMESPSGKLGKPQGLVRAWVVGVCGLCAGEGRPGWPPRGRCEDAARGVGTAHLRARNLGREGRLKSRSQVVSLIISNPRL